MIDMIHQWIVPAFKSVGMDTAVIASIQTRLNAVHAAQDGMERATIEQELRLEVMEEARKACDEAEGKCPATVWPFATYRDLLFLDQNHNHQGVTTRF